MSDFDTTGLYTGKQRGYMETYPNGVPVNPLDIKPEDLHIETIAHALSLICRFGGHVKEFYSVAEHCIRVSQIVLPEYKLAALLHDSSEAYLGDIIRPIKYSIRWFEDLDKKTQSTVMKRFGIDYNEVVEKAVKDADNRLGFTEGRDLMYKVETWGKFTGFLPDKIIPLSSGKAERIFLRLFRQYGGKD